MSQDAADRSADRRAGYESASGDSLSHQKTFNYTGAKQSFTVLTGVSSITIVALGAEARVRPSGCPHGGLGGRVSAVFRLSHTANRHRRRWSGRRGERWLQRRRSWRHGARFVGLRWWWDSDVRAGHGRCMDRRLVAGGGGGAGGSIAARAVMAVREGKPSVSRRRRRVFSYNGGGGGGGGW